MVNLLSGLVSGKVRKPVIINGKLLMYDGNIVAVHREKYKVVVSYLKNRGQEVIIEDGEELFNQMANDFNKKFIFSSVSLDKSITEFNASIDSFTGAVVLKNNLYDLFLDKYNEMHLHDGTMQFKSELSSKILEFNKYFIINYFGIYLYLFNRRLMGNYMPIKIKAHLTNGLFQPLVLRTRGVDCPLELPEFNWFREYLNTPEVTEKQIEGLMETNRDMELTVIAMSDFSKKFGGRILRGLDRTYFVFIIYCNMMDYIEKDSWLEMAKCYDKLYRQMQDGDEDSRPIPLFMRNNVE